MSNDVVISVENLSKRCRIGAKEQGYKNFSEAVMDALTAPFRNFRNLRNLTKFDEARSLPFAPCSGLPAPCSLLHPPCPSQQGS